MNIKLLPHLWHNYDNLHTKLRKNFQKIKYFPENEIIIKDVSLAEFHCLALDEKGKKYGWGGNLFNKLGRKYDILAGIPNQILIKNKIMFLFIILIM